MFPAIFSVDFQGQGQRSKVTVIGKQVGFFKKNPIERCSAS